MNRLENIEKMTSEFLSWTKKIVVVALIFLIFCCAFIIYSTVVGSIKHSQRQILMGYSEVLPDIKNEDVWVRKIDGNKIAVSDDGLMQKNHIFILHWDNGYTVINSQEHEEVWVNTLALAAESSVPLRKVMK